MSDFTYALLGWYNFKLVLQYLPEFGRGLGNTLFASAVTLAASLALGLMIALARLSTIGALTAPAYAYVQFIRSTPLLIQIYLVYYSIPIIAPAAARWPEMALGIIALTIHTTPYMSEILRSAIAAVPRGQIEGAIAVGMSPYQRMRHVVLPQALANTLPALLGQTAILVKDTSLLSLITVFDLVSAGMLLNSDRVKPNEGFLTVAAIYLAIYLVLLFASGKVERGIAGSAWNRKVA